MPLRNLINRAAKAVTETSTQNYGYIVPAQAATRIRIIFDDSGSMAGQKIEDAQIGCEEFLRVCTLNQTAVAVHPMNGRFRGQTELTLSQKHIRGHKCVPSTSAGPWHS
jgi:hypothetical protein